MGERVEQPVRVVVVGGGVAALEFILVAHKLGDERLCCTLVAPESVFSYRPASVAVAFDQAEVFRFPIGDIAEAAGAVWEQARVIGVDASRHVALLDCGVDLGYDALVVATGARRVPVLEEAITFRDEDDIPRMERLLEEIDRGAVRSVAFVLPVGATWPLPLYELALLTAQHALNRPFRSRVSVSLVTPEDEPLALFGGEASTAVRRLLRDRGIRLHERTHPASLSGDTLSLIPTGTLHVDRVVAMPAAHGTPIPGLPDDPAGFLPVDGHGRVIGTPDVYAIGDATNHPIKQGGIAAEQAHLVAQLLAHHAGAPVAAPPPYAPYLRGLLLTGDEPMYLEAQLTGGHGSTGTISSDPLWWPGGKIAAPHLANHLTTAGRR